jgi:hypothetical protein
MKHRGHSMKKKLNLKKNSLVMNYKNKQKRKYFSKKLIKGEDW